MHLEKAAKLQVREEEVAIVEKAKIVMVEEEKGGEAETEVLLENRQEIEENQEDNKQIKITPDNLHDFLIISDDSKIIQQTHK